MDTNKQMSTRRTALKVSGGVLTGGLLAGCSGNNNEGEGDGSGSGNGSGATTTTARSSEGKEVTVVTQQGSPRGKKAFAALKERFEEQTPHTLEVVYTPEVLEEVPKRIRGGNPPEIVTANTSEAVGWLEKGALAPVTDVVSEIEEELITNEYNVQRNGEHYALSWAVNPSSLNTWRNDWLEDAGLGIDVGADGAAARSWDDLLTMAKECDARGDREHGMIITVAETKKGTVDSTNFTMSNGAEWYGVENGEPVVTIDQGKNLDRAVEALEFMQELYQYSPETIGWDWRDDFNTFLKGNVGGVLYAYGRILEGAQANNPSMTDIVAPLAQPNSSNVDAKHASTRASGASLILMGGDELDTNEEAGRDYLRFLLDNPDLFKEFALATPFWKIPTIKSLQDAYVEAPEISDSPKVADQMFQIVEQTTQNVSLEGGIVNPAAGKVYSNGTHGKALHDMIVDGKDSQQAVMDMADEIRTFL